MVERTHPTGTYDDDLIQRIPVPFQEVPEAIGDSSRSGPLSWGQRDLWQIMERKDSWLPIGTVLPLPADTTVADAVADLRAVMGRYPSMRTRVHREGGEPVQAVADRGEAALEVVDVPDGADPAQAAEDAWQRLAEAAYDVATDWPIRMAVVRHRGALTHRVWVMCHLATDGGGARVIAQDLANGRQAPAGPPQSPPLEQARWQASPPARRHCEAAMRHWERILRQAPAERFPPRPVTPSPVTPSPVTPSPVTPSPRYWQGRFTSPALHLATGVICARTGVESASVLLALFAAVLARRTGINPVVVQVTVGNRFRPGLARTVSPVMQNGLCQIDVPAGTVDDAVRHTRQRAFATYKHAYYDPRRREELIARVSEERGEPVDLSCFFNDRRLNTRDLGAAGPPAATRAAAAVADHQFEWRYQQDRHRFDKLYLNLDDVPDTVRMTVLCDTHFVPGAEVEQCLFEMEQLGVAAAGDPATRTSAPAPGDRP